MDPLWRKGPSDDSPMCRASPPQTQAILSDDIGMHTAVRERNAASADAMRAASSVLRTG